MRPKSPLRWDVQIWYLSPSSLLPHIPLDIKVMGKVRLEYNISILPHVSYKSLTVTETPKSQYAEKVVETSIQGTGQVAHLPLSTSPL